MVTGKSNVRSGDAAGSSIVELDEAMRLLKTSRSTLYRWVREGQIRAQKAGRQWRFERSEIDRFLRGDEPRIELRTNISPLIADLEERLAGLEEKPSVERGESEVLYAVRLLLDLGLALGASDIHVAPNLGENGQADRAVVRYRVDGVLHPTVEIDIRLLPPLVAQWKMLFSCNPGETSKPQDGLLKEAFGARVHFAQSMLGPTVVTRLMPPVEDQRTLDTLGLSDGDREKVLRAVQAPAGVICFDGPTGSGRTTTAYACLKKLAVPSRKVLTIEDPVEVLFPWMVQMQARPSEGFTIASALTSMFRSDPDVLYVCEVRDSEVLDIVVRGALNGHLVLTTLSAVGSAKALLRMVEMGASPFAVGEAVKLVLSQRLARRVCPDCSEPAEPVIEQMRRALELARSGGLSFGSLPQKWRRAVGCPKCKGLGYRGRLMLAEALTVTPEIGQALRRKAGAAEITAIAVGQGMTTMLADGIRRAAAGETTLDEVSRILAPGV